MRKYGLENFTLSVIEECQEEDLDKKERYWINQLNSLVPNGYNILEGGQSNRSYATFCKKCGKQMIANPTEDAIKLAKKKLDDVRDYKLETVSRSFGLEEQKHRALDDCYLIHRVYEKLKDFE